MAEEELRAQIASYGVPQKLLRAYENAVAQRTKESCRKDLDAWVYRAMDSSNESLQLRLLYGTEQEKAQKQELFIRLLQERSELAKKVLGKMAAHCRTLRAQVFGDSSERGASQTATVPAAHHDFDPSDNTCRCGGTLEDTGGQINFLAGAFAVDPAVTGLQKLIANGEGR